MSLICALLTYWYSLPSLFRRTPLGMAPISGHDYVEVQSGPTGWGYQVQELRCRRCDRISVGWT